MYTSNLLDNKQGRKEGRKIPQGTYINELNVNGQNYNSDGGFPCGFIEHLPTLAEQIDNCQFNQTYLDNH